MTDFSSVDRLVEFGLGLGIARQMMSTMNSAMGNMQVAGVESSVHNAAIQQASGFYALIDDAQAGPLTADELQQAVAGGLINADTLMWNAGMTGWRQARNIPSVYKMILLRNAKAQV